MGTSPQGGARGATSGRAATVVLVALGVAVVAVLALVLSDPFGHAGGDTSPVDLSTPVHMADGVAHQSAVVRVGDARIEVLSPSLLRLEYSPTATFENSPTVNAVDRRMAVPRYSTHVSGGWLTLRTADATLRYRVGSGPFTPADTSIRYDVAGRQTTVHPTWDWECPFDQSCQAGAAALSGGAQLRWTVSGYQSDAGYVGPLPHGAAATWSVLGAPGGEAVLAVRYSAQGGAAPASALEGVDLVVDGRPGTVVDTPPTSGDAPWATVTTTASLRAGTNTVELRCDRPGGCGAALDTLSVGPAPGPAPAPLETGPLGGWVRGFDTFTYGSLPTCAPGSAGATCANTFEPLHTDGLLDQAGWRLLDDTQSALWNSRGWVQPRPRGGDEEDGYLFVYGHDYAGALHTLARLTGASPLLPRNVFGVWYSDYTPYSARDIEDTVYGAFAREGVPLDTLSLDTDWKAPSDWDGWEWASSLFPNPSAFLHWAKAHGIDVTLNIHSSIALDDPDMDRAQSVAGGTLAKSACTAGICRIWDWSSIPQAESNFDLQQSLQAQGVSFFWLDWCCDNSVVSMRGVTPDAWIGHLYAQQMVNEGERGFVLARIGSSNGNPQRVYAAGPWSDHTSAIAFTGDAWGTWATLAQEVALTPDEATIGEPYVSDDIGSYLGPPPQGTQDTADLYDRWVQFGTFEPLMRLHSNDEKRLPWQYPQPVRAIADSFLRLREALVPYTYTLAAQAHRDGLPMTRPLYLDYPGQAAAYDHPGEYLYGPDVLVAPVTSPGSEAQTTLWVPPGRWTDYFTGATVNGPTTISVDEPLDRMPVFVRAGGIIPEAPSSTGSASHSGDHVVLHVYPGANGAFDLYGDSGTGLGYEKGQSTTTAITDTVLPAEPSTPAGDDAMAVDVTVGAARGHYPGAPGALHYQIDLVDLSAPSQVELGGRPLDRRAPGSATPGWSYDEATATVVVTTTARPTDRAFTVAVAGTHAVDRSEPPVPAP